MPRKEPRWQGQWASLVIPLALPDLASLLPVFISQDLESAQQCQQHETDGKAHTCHSTSWQRARLQEMKGFWMSKVEPSVKHLAVLLQWNLWLPTHRLKDMMFILYASPPRGSEWIIANSSSQGTLPKSAFIIVEADGTTNTYLMAQAENPGVILDFFSSTPNHPPASSASKTHPLTPSPLPWKTTVISHLAS